jgi:hypothetical protein
VTSYGVLYATELEALGGELSRMSTYARGEDREEVESRVE